jgi:hypothetical protein
MVAGSLFWRRKDSAHFWNYTRRFMKYWEIIANNLKKCGWSLGWVSTVDRDGRTIWIVDAQRDDGMRLVVHANEKLTALVEVGSAIRLERESNNGSA